MCHIKAIKFTCGHIRHKTVSNCRLTFANPQKTLALCRAEPSLYLDHSVDCRECEFQKFQNLWECRFEEARKRQRLAQEAMQNDADDKSWMEIGDDDCAEGADIFWEDRDDRVSKANMFTSNDEELTRLYAQYHQEIWTHWQWYMAVSWDTKEDTAQTHNKSRKSKRPGRRCSETSPLRKVISADELEEDLFYSDSSSYSSTEPSRLNSSAGSSEGSPVWPNFEWTEYQWEDEEAFADSLSDALDELNCRETTC